MARLTLPAAVDAVSPQRPARRPLTPATTARRAAIGEIRAAVIAADRAAEALAYARSRVGALLRTTRESYALALDDVADASSAPKIDQSTLSRLERGLTWDPATVARAIVALDAALGLYARRSRGVMPGLGGSGGSSIIGATGFHEPEGEGEDDSDDGQRREAAHG